MTLQALGRQYAEHADRLTELIASCKERRREAVLAGDSIEAERLGKLRGMYKRQQTEVIQISARLLHYYDHRDASACEEPVHKTKGWIPTRKTIPSTTCTPTSPTAPRT